MRRCKAVTHNGQQCPNKARPDSDYCAQHAHLEELFREAQSAMNGQQPWWRKLRMFWKESKMQFDPSRIDERMARRLGAGVVGIILLVAVMSRAVGVTNITADQVAVVMNNLTRTPTLRTQVGAIVYCPFYQDIYVLDKTRQTLEMTAAQGKGDRPGRDDVKIKTIDGSDVNVDITINYEIDPEKAMEILSTSGIGDAYKQKWVRDYARTICRDKFGELDTDEFYDSTQREEKARESLDELNAALNPWGIHVTDVIPQDFHFYEEYEQKIREKKECDQEIEEQKSKAKAAAEMQKFVEMEERKKMDVEVARFNGKMEKLRIDAEAERDRVMRQADAYAITAKAAADADFIKFTKQAEGIRATKTAEAEGIKAMVSALQGPGGRNLVKMEYARQLQNLRITGTPVSIDGLMEKFEHSTARQRTSAAASKAAAPPGSSSPSPKQSKQ